MGFSCASSLVQTKVTHDTPPGGNFDLSAGYRRLIPESENARLGRVFQAKAASADPVG